MPETTRRIIDLLTPEMMEADRKARAAIAEEDRVERNKLRASLGLPLLE